LKEGQKEVIKDDDTKANSQSSAESVIAVKAIEGGSVNQAKQEDMKAGNEPGSGTQFLPIELANPNKGKGDSVITVETAVPAAKGGISADTVVKVAMINSDCKSNATEEDFLKLRKKMAGAEVEEEMLAAAKKYFKTRCFTTDQVKNLSVLFLKDSAKYNFFDLSYQYVSDSHNFSILQSQLTEAYYISRFKAMIRQ
jgi:hypothetical protein